jgi:hypothetical protein
MASHLLLILFIESYLTSLSFRLSLPYLLHLFSLPPFFFPTYVFLISASLITILLFYLSHPFSLKILTVVALNYLFHHQIILLTPRKNLKLYFSYYFSGYRRSSRKIFGDSFTRNRWVMYRTGWHVLWSEWCTN